MVKRFYGVRQCPNLKKNLTNERELSSFKKKMNYEHELVHYHLCELNFELVLLSMNWHNTVGYINAQNGAAKSCNNVAAI